jgi:hypothetical protein
LVAWLACLAFWTSAAWFAINTWFADRSFLANNAWCSFGPWWSWCYNDLARLSNSSNGTLAAWTSHSALCASHAWCALLAISTCFTRCSFRSFWSLGAHHAGWSWWTWWANDAWLTRCWCWQHLAILTILTSNTWISVLSIDTVFACIAGRTNWTLVACAAASLDLDIWVNNRWIGGTISAVLRHPLSE